jgi:hypothetical protein
MVASVVVMLVAEIAEITGGVVSEGGGVVEPETNSKAPLSQLPSAPRVTPRLSVLYGEDNENPEAVPANNLKSLELGLTNGLPVRFCSPPPEPL